MYGAVVMLPHILISPTTLQASLLREAGAVRRLKGLFVFARETPPPQAVPLPLKRGGCDALRILEGGRMLFAPYGYSLVICLKVFVIL